MNYYLFISLTIFFLLLLVITFCALTYPGFINTFKDKISQIFYFFLSRVFNLLLSLIFYFLLLFPFKLILPLLGLDYILPIFYGLYACIFTVAFCFFESKGNIFNFFQLVYIFTIAAAVGYLCILCKELGLPHFLLAFTPMLLEGGINDPSVSLFSKIALFMEGNKGSNNSPVLGSSPIKFMNTPTPSPSPPPSFEQLLWYNRERSSGDAKALDYSKRLLLNKICEKNGIPEDVKMCIQDNIWGNHWYSYYRIHRNNPLGLYTSII